MAQTIKKKDGSVLNVLQYKKLEIVLKCIDEEDSDIRLDESDLVGDLEHAFREVINDLGYECARVELA